MDGGRAPRPESSALGPPPLSFCVTRSYELAMNRTRVLRLGFGGILGVAILAVVLISGPDTGSLNVVYCGSTNKQQVLFTINNRTARPVTYWMGLPQVKTNGRAHR